ncbi:MAG: hypothetical protein MZV70_33940 [Desulfobacterales bacterium]|nr:hypothetical protein [Desulfobacterales bacterium]
MNKSADGRGARRAAAGHLPDDRLEPRRGAARPAACSSRTSTLYRQLRHVRARSMLSLVRADGAHGPLPRRPARARRRRQHDLRPRRLRPLLGADLRGSEGLVVHEVPVPALRSGREDGWYRVGPLARVHELRLHPDAARRRASGASSSPSTAAAPAHVAARLTTGRA